MFMTIRSWSIPKRARQLTALVILAVTLALAGPALAHERIEVGPYVIVVGWQNEPPIVGERNAILLEVTEGETPVEGVESGLNLELLYGGQSYRSNLSPAGEPGVYLAELFPTVRGQYSVHLIGTIGDTAVDVTVEPEEVFPGSRLQFPQAQPDPLDMQEQIAVLEGQLETARLLAIGGLVAGLIGLVVAALGLRRRAP
jgi:hypothetical protein